MVERHLGGGGLADAGWALDQSMALGEQRGKQQVRRFFRAHNRGNQPLAELSELVSRHEILLAAADRMETLFAKSRGKETKPKSSIIRCSNDSSFFSLL